MVLTSFLRTRFSNISRSGAIRLPLPQQTTTSSRSLSTQSLSVLNQSDVQLHGTTLTSLRDVMMQVCCRTIYIVTIVSLVISKFTNI
jgi:hypothetical protein